jgi:hypothetical protein
MSKLNIHLKITGFELKIEGERHQAPAIAKQLTTQFSGLLNAQQLLADSPRADIPIEPAEPSRTNRRLRSKPSARDGLAFDFKHDPTQYGSPKLSWTTAQKAIWLLYVLRQQTEYKGAGASNIAATFNKHFREARAISAANVHRDMGKMKQKTPPAVGEDTSQKPYLWYLTEEGVKTAKGLIENGALVE